ncbi:MAG: adenosylcobinamide-phosphate synthase CbiB [Butyrivibrio sp.]|nr:adenosylcobinamide-phosphate synthase CbiB [Butyrivibrio sp.]
MILHTIALAAGIILDRIVGDPYNLPHPVKAMGRLISFLEKRLLHTEGVRNKTKERTSGFLMWLTVVFSSAFITLILLGISYGVNKYLGAVIESVLTCYVLAAKSLCKESMKVHAELEKKDIFSARKALSMIVGRDTKELDVEEIAKAAVETVAENTSDGIIAPLIFTAIGGPVLGNIYKAVNTMDSMVGYKNEKYENFGFFPAKADDVFNYIPSRISAVFMVLSAYILGIFDKAYNGKNAFRIWIRDRYNHRSPNSAQTESVCAGALGLKLGGTHLYAGMAVEKPTIGDELRKTESSDIKRANRLMFLTEDLLAVLLLLLLVIVIV